MSTFKTPTPAQATLASLVLVAGIAWPGIGAAQSTAQLWSTGGGDKSYTPTGQTWSYLGSRNFDTSGDGMSNTSDNFWSYCIDRDTGFSGGSTYNVLSGLDAYLTTPTFGAPATKTYYQQQMSTGAYAATNAYGDLTTGSVVKTRLEELFRYAYADSMTSNLKSTAFQFAVWEVLGDASLSRTAGFNTLTNADTAFTGQIDTYLGALGSHNWGGLQAQDYTFTIYMSLNTSQGQISVKPTGGGTVPEPASLLLVAMAGAAAVAGTRRVRRKAAQSQT